MSIVDDGELKRREQYLRAKLLPYSLYDPFTWSYPAKTAFFTAIGVGSLHYLYNGWSRKPIYYGVFPRVKIGIAFTALTYLLAIVREHHNKTRDAVVEHYISIHPGEFERVQQHYGRPHSEIFLPWLPKRTHYTKYD